MVIDQNMILAVLLTAMAVFWIFGLILLVIFAILMNVKKKNPYTFIIFKANKYGVIGSKIVMGRRDVKEKKYIYVHRFTGKKLGTVNAEISENYCYNDSDGKNRLIALILEKDGAHSQLKFDEIPENLGIKAIRTDVFSFIVDEGKKLLDKYAKKDTDLNRVLLVGTFTVLSLTIILLIVVVAIVFTIGPDAAKEIQALKTSGKTINNVIPNVPG